MLSQKSQYEYESKMNGQPEAVDKNPDTPGTPRSPTPGRSNNTARKKAPCSPTPGPSTARETHSQTNKGDGTGEKDQDIRSSKVLDLSWIDDEVIDLESIDEDEL